MTETPEEFAGAAAAGAIGSIFEETKGKGPALQGLSFSGNRVLIFAHIPVYCIFNTNSFIK